MVYWRETIVCVPSSCLDTENLKFTGHIKMFNSLNYEDFRPTEPAKMYQCLILNGVLTSGPCPTNCSSHRSKKSTIQCGNAY